MKKLITFYLLLAAVFPAFSFQVKYGENIIISTPLWDDLYISGGTVTINAAIHGDMIIAGGNITINDTIYNDLLLAGGTVKLNGYVGDDIRCAGGQLHISKNVAGDAVIAGGTVIIEKDAVLNRLLVAGGNIVVDGTVVNEIKCSSGNFTLNGTAGSELDIRAGKININGVVKGASELKSMEELTIGNEAVFNKDVRYWTGKGKADFKNSIREENTYYDHGLAMKPDKKYFAGMGIIGLLWYLGAIVLLIIIIRYFFDSILQKAGESFHVQPLKSFGRGILFFFLIPALAILSFITIIGIPIGIILLIMYGLTLSLVTCITALVITHSLKNRKYRRAKTWQVILISIAIFTLLKLLLLIPVLGWLTMFICACVAIGAVILNIKRHPKNHEPAPV